MDLDIEEDGKWVLIGLVLSILVIGVYNGYISLPSLGTSGDEPVPKEEPKEYPVKRSYGPIKAMI